MSALRQFLLLAAAVCVIAPLAAAQPSTPAAPGDIGCTADQSFPALPLHTSGRFIVDRLNRRFKLNSVNWYGSEGDDYVVGGLQLEPLEAIVRRIRCMGFNSVRLPWSNEMVESNPVVGDYALTANPEFEGQHAMQIFDAVVRALTSEGLLVILDNHNSNAEWCCSNDGNTLWYNSDYPESSWISDWEGMAQRYRNNPLVIGADLRNEPRINATWGGPASTDWHAAAERGGDAVQSVNPNLLIFVEGINYAGDLAGVASLPVQLNVPNHVVYEAHDYSYWYSSSTLASYSGYLNVIMPDWGYLVTGSNPQPLWIGEFGNCHTSATCVTDTTASDGSGGLWFSYIRQFLAANDIDWSWWAVNGTETTGSGRTFGSEETYGVLNPYWNAPAVPNQLPLSSLNVLGALQTIASPSQGPAVRASYPPLVSVTLPLPGSTIVSGITAVLTATANVRMGSTDSISKVIFYADGRLIGAATSAPYTVNWTNIPPGNYSVVAQAVTASGESAFSESVPFQAINYLAAAPSDTDAISINFVSYAVTPMAPSEIAGVVPRANWNQAGVANSGTLSNLVDENGVATTASVTWSAPDTYSTPIPDQPGNDAMMKGYLDNSNTVPNSVSVEGLPASFQRYDVYVYFNGGTNTSARVANYRITSVDSSGALHGCAGQSWEGSTITGTDAADAYFSGTFMPASGGSAGNYVLFIDCSGSSFNLAPVHAGSTDGDSQVRAPVNGIQIVAHP
jgi:endoglucanase